MEEDIRKKFRTLISREQPPFNPILLSNEQIELVNFFFSSFILTLNLIKKTIQSIGIVREKFGNSKKNL